MYSTITLLILLLSLIKMIVCDSSVKSCSLARDKCANKLQCFQAYQDFNSSCKSEIRGIIAHHCSLNCQSAVVTLSVIKEGNQFLNCECDHNNDEEHENCVLLQKRIGICLADKYTLNKAIIIISEDFDQSDDSNECYSRLLNCKSEVSCADQYQLFRYLCKNALKGEFCNLKCRRSVTTLEKQISGGFSVRECKCDHNYCNVCEFEKNNLINACFSNTTVHNNNNNSYNYSDLDICDPQNQPKLIAKLEEDNNYLTTDTSKNNYDLLEFEIVLLILCLIMSFI